MATIFKTRIVVTSTESDFSAGTCDACGTTREPLVKVSLGKDFFGRTYDRLSPSSDLSPKWYCERCSVHKNLQRDFRDIRAEFDKLSKGQASEIAGADHLQRAQRRLQDIAAVLEGYAAGTSLIDLVDVNALISRIQAQVGSQSVSR